MTSKPQRTSIELYQHHREIFVEIAKRELPALARNGALVRYANATVLYLQAHPEVARAIADSVMRSYTRRKPEGDAA